MWLNLPGRVIFNEDKERHKEDTEERERQMERHGWRRERRGERQFDSASHETLNQSVTLRFVLLFLRWEMTYFWQAASSSSIHPSSIFPPPTVSSTPDRLKLCLAFIKEAELCDTVNTEEGKHPSAFSNQSSLGRYDPFIKLHVWSCGLRSTSLCLFHIFSCSSLYLNPLKVVVGKEYFGLRRN